MNDNLNHNGSADQFLVSELGLATKLDPSLEPLINNIGYPEPRIRSASFETLLHIIVSQQLSTKAAAAISSRLSGSCNGEITWRKILNRSEAQLKACGLSIQKINYARSLALSLKNKELELDQLIHMDTDEVLSTLMKIKGFGRWSAEIYAMFALQHRDIYPAGDLALRIALGKHFGLGQEPDEATTRKMSELWQPHRSAVALLMWKFYGSTTLGK